MHVFFDTTVLVAASEQSHPYHARALPALRRVVTGHDVGFVSAHSIAETYAALTRLPVQPRIHPSEAARIITENIVPSCTVVPPHARGVSPGTDRGTGCRDSRGQNL